MNEAIGWALIHFLWEGAAIALILAVILSAARRSTTRYAAACLALVAMVAAFALTLAIQLPRLESPAAAVHVPAGVLPPPAVDDAGIPAKAPVEPYRWAVPIWLAGVTILSLHRLAGFAGAYRLRHTGNSCAPESWQARMRQLAARLGIERRVQLLESCLTETPVTAGYLRPAILLPMGMLAGLPGEQVEYILIHELAHIARADYLVNILQSMAEALLFYHPAVWWVSKVIRTEREHCCDDRVVALSGDARAYAAALVTLEQTRSMAPALAATGGSLTHRVRRLLAAPTPQSVAAPIVAAALALAAVGVALAAHDPQQIAPLSVTMFHPAAPVLVAQAAQPAAPQRPVMKKDSDPANSGAGIQSPYRKWMTEDVAYIITDAERHAFKSLLTDAEREQFIEQFWLRRDPTPGTVENEFKEEHYRRIAYTNEHFSSQIPGWKTDRGRVYITYGPPDEIDDHSNTSLGTTPYQLWRYRWIEGVGTNVIIEFIDPNRDGEYRMTSDPTEKAAATQANQFQRLEQFSKLQKPPAGPFNVFVSNEPGGRVSVHVPQGNSTPAQNGRTNPRTVTVSLPLSSPGQYYVQGAVKQADGRVVAGFEDEVKSSEYNFPLRIEPGAYILDITYKDVATGELHHETSNFFVN